MSEQTEDEDLSLAIISSSEVQRLQPYYPLKDFDDIISSGQAHREPFDLTSNEDMFDVDHLLNSIEDALLKESDLQDYFEFEVPRKKQSRAQMTLQLLPSLKMPDDPKLQVMETHENGRNHNTSTTAGARLRSSQKEIHYFRSFTDSLIHNYVGGPSLRKRFEDVKIQSRGDDQAVSICVDKSSLDQKRKRFEDLFYSSTEEEVEDESDQEKLPKRVCHNNEVALVMGQDLFPIRIGDKFTSAEEFRDAITTSSIQIKKEIDFTKSESRRIRAKCSTKGCKWRIFAGAEKDSEDITKTLVKKKRCSSKDNFRHPYMPNLDE